MGLSPVMEIWNVTDLWNLIEEEEGLRWKHREKDGRKHIDKRGFMITSMDLCVQCALQQRFVCMCTTGVCMCAGTSERGLVCVHACPFLACVSMYIIMCVCFLWPMCTGVCGLLCTPM